ncbi:MAG: hypothetical protein AABX59_02855 [Nanoarchaeota archaeon]
MVLPRRKLPDPKGSYPYRDSAFDTDNPFFLSNLTTDANVAALGLEMVLRGIASRDPGYSQRLYMQGLMATSIVYHATKINLKKHQRWRALGRSLLLLPPRRGRIEMDGALKPPSLTFLA